MKHTHLKQEKHNNITQALSQIYLLLDSNHREKSTLLQYRKTTLLQCEATTDHLIEWKKEKHTKTSRDVIEQMNTELADVLDKKLVHEKDEIPPLTFQQVQAVLVNIEKRGGVKHKDKAEIDEIYKCAIEGCKNYEHPLNESDKQVFYFIQDGALTICGSCWRK